MKTICIVSQKGGVGKTTTALALGYALAEWGNRVLFVDLDPQCNLSYALRYDKTRPNVYQALIRACTPKDSIQRLERVDLMGGSNLMSSIDSALTRTGKEHRLREAINDVGGYDWVICDCPPNLGVAIVNALTCADYVVTPIQPDAFSLQALDDLNETIKAVRQYTNPRIEWSGIVLNRYNQRATLPREIAKMVDNAARGMGTKLFKTKIRECIAVKESQALGRSLFEYAPDSNASADYRELLDEIIEGGKHGKK